MEKQKAPGKHYRAGVSMMHVADMFATEDQAVEWFERWLWPDGEITCMRCGSVGNAYRVKSGKPMPYRCRDCKKYFSLKTGTAMEDSKLPLRTWGWAIYLEMTSLKGVSSMKLRRDLGISQPTAWFLLHRIREAFADVTPLVFEGPVEVDEAYVGGKLQRMRRDKRREARKKPLQGKTAVMGMKDRATNRVVAEVVPGVNRTTANKFIDAHIEPDAEVYTDGAPVYRGRKNHEWVSHSEGEYVRYLKGVKIHTNGVESFWSMLKRAHKGVYHKLSAKHLQRYVCEFAGRQNIREMDTLEQMQHVVAGLIGRRLTYKDLVAD